MQTALLLHDDKNNMFLIRMNNDIYNQFCEYDFTDKQNEQIVISVCKAKTDALQKSILEE